MTPSQAPTPPDLLEQAHLALLRGHLDQARSLLDRLVAAEPGNADAQDLRATVIARQAAVDETARLQSGLYPGEIPPATTGSVWTRPLPDPASVLLNSPSARKWPKPLLLAVCLLAGVAAMLLPSRRHHHSYHSDWRVDAALGLIGGATLFVWILVKRR